mmetsp:Transcript_19465/g.54705  ORF Transcript_19465/g.54705 Transcript_19465/m.54705 type:complete len:256 (-) Transcript_19465:380-1147(-)
MPAKSSTRSPEPGPRTPPGTGSSGPWLRSPGFSTSPASIRRGSRHARPLRRTWRGCWLTEGLRSRRRTPSSTPSGLRSSSPKTAGRGSPCPKRTLGRRRTRPRTWCANARGSPKVKWSRPADARCPSIRRRRSGSGRGPAWGTARGTRRTTTARPASRPSSPGRRGCRSPRWAGGRGQHPPCCEPASSATATARRCRNSAPARGNISSMAPPEPARRAEGGGGGCTYVHIFWGPRYKPGARAAARGPAPAARLSG